MKTALVIWVTSDCNLHCPLCSQRYTMQNNKGYQMTMNEVLYIVDSCRRRKLHFDSVEITGGEPSLWKNIKEGVKLFSEIAGEVTLVTNGNNPELIMSLNLKRWGVSSSQATKEQLQKFEPVSDRIFYNAHQHRKYPVTPLSGVLPSKCCVQTSPWGEQQNQMMYMKGNIYYCCNAFALSERVGLSSDIVCNFEDDFIKKYGSKDFMRAICTVCLCNAKVWSRSE